MKETRLLLVEEQTEETGEKETQSRSTGQRPEDLAQDRGGGGGQVSGGGDNQTQVENIEMIRQVGGRTRKTEPRTQNLKPIMEPKLSKHTNESYQLGFNLDPDPQQPSESCLLLTALAEALL